MNGTKGPRVGQKAPVGTRQHYGSFATNLKTSMYKYVNESFQPDTEQCPIAQTECGSAQQPDLLGSKPSLNFSFFCIGASMQSVILSASSMLSYLFCQPVG